MRCLVTVIAIFALSHPLGGQATQQAKEKKHKNKEFPAQVDLAPHDAARVFTAEQPIAFTLTANFDRLRHDKRKADAPWRWATLTMPDSTGANVVVPLKVKTRGIWRLKECDFPPIRLDFAKQTVKHTLLEKLDKPKLVTHCRDNDEYEQYVLQEMQLYRIYSLLTPYSHRVRLTRVMYADSASGKPITTRYAFLQEEPEAMAYRVGGLLMKQQGAGSDDLDREAAAIFFLFQYMIGNTDFSVAALHNVELISHDTANIPVAHDFDFAGAVNTRYATTDPSLSIRRVRDRLYRGYCLPDEAYSPAVGLFQSMKDSIYALYRDPIGKLLTGNRAKETLEYFDDFYATIGDFKAFRREILDHCINRRI